MRIDLTVPVSPSVANAVQQNNHIGDFGHLGTHFDVMNKVFPLEFVRREGIVFDVTGAGADEVALADVDISKIREDMFVAFFTGFLERQGYGTEGYFSCHPMLSHQLINQLIERKISIIGIDCAGVRRGKEHSPADQLCADNGVFVVENLSNLQKILEGKKTSRFIANTYPVNFVGISGLPCRVVAELVD